MLMPDVLTVKARLLQSTTTVRNLAWQFGLSDWTAARCLAACNGRAAKCQRTLAAAVKTLEAPWHRTVDETSARQRKNRERYEQAVLNNVLVLANQRKVTRV
jgi:hypothetical protein